MISCPCDRFDSIESIREALDSAESIQHLRAWLSGSAHQFASTGECRTRLSCGSTCRKRVKVSFTILNGIRDACRPYLESSTGLGGANAQHQVTPKKKKEPSYNEAFPSLGGSEVGKRNAASKHKRRIRPALVTQPKTTVAPAWNLVNVSNDDDPSFPALGFRRSSGEATLSSRSKNNIASAVAAEVIVATTPKKKPGLVPATSSSWPSNTEVTPKKTAKHQADKPSAHSLDKTAPLEITKEMDRLVDIYTALIYNCLVPSSALELHLLIRLLSASGPANGIETTTAPLASIFFSPEACIAFAAAALRKLSNLLIGLGPILFKDLLRCQPFQQHLPDLTEQFTALQQDFNTSQQQSSGANFISVSINQTALFTLPFNEERDSRHHFRTREAQTAYKNREESRDAFLYQLRAFLHARGTLVDSTQANRAIQNVRQSSHLVVRALMDVNQPWFAEFFCEMLLQIGNVPIQETDQDLLKIMDADQDKLQKLHRRFSTKTTHSDRSSKPLMFDKSSSSSSSPEAAAQPMFPHHQEFFYLFLLSADSYNFSMHLRARLVTLLSVGARDISEAADLRRKVMDLRLLAKFLGVLLFSPNWRSSRDSTGTVVYDLSLDGLHQLEHASGLSIVKCMEEAFEDPRLLVVTLSWAVELLRPSQWDTPASQSPVYLRILTLLRQVQLDSFHVEEEIAGSCLSVKILIGQYLESLFSETVGLSHSTKLVPFLNPKPLLKETIPLDDGILHCATTLVASNAQLDDLLALLSNMTKMDSSSMRSPGATRKLRPSVISPTVLSLDTPVISPSPTTFDGVTASETLAFASTGTPLTLFQSKLRDAFFHQHRDLKLICEFATSQALRNIGTELVTKQIQPLLPENLTSDDSLSDIRTVALNACLAFLRSSLQEQVTGAVTALGPSRHDSTVKGIAITLAVEHGEQSGRQMVYSLVDAEMKKAGALLMRENKKRLFDNETKAESLDENNQSVDYADDSLTACASLMRDAAHKLKSVAADDSGTALAALRSLNEMLGEISSASDLSMPGGRIFRPFFEAVLSLDSVADSVLGWCFAETSSVPAKKRWQLLSEYLLTAVALTRLSRHGLQNLRRALSNDTEIEKLLHLGKESEDCESLETILAKLSDTMLLKRFARRIGSIDDTI